MDATKRRRLWSAAAVSALAIVTLLRFLYLRWLPGGGTFVKYLWFADEILAGRVHRDRLADLSPAYLWFVTFVRWAGFGDWAIRGLQVAMVSIVAGCAGVTARRFGGWVAGVGAAVIVLANRAALVNATDFEPETLLLMLEAIAIALLVRPEPLRSRRVILTAGFLLGLAITTRPVALLPAIVLAVYLLCRSRAVPWLLAAAAATPVALVLLLNTFVTGDTVLMDPGTVFYEGMNPRATGCGGRRPVIISDLQPVFDGPDTLHVAYRYVASLAQGRRAISRQESNRWWAGHALAFLRLEPLEAAKLTLRKAASVVESHDVWDVPSAAILEREMILPLWIPWSLAIALALPALLVARRKSAGTFAALALASALPMLLFFVTARHRNPLLIPVAILAGLAIEGILHRLRSGERARPVLALALAVVAGALLSIDTACARQDDYVWRSFAPIRAANEQAARAARSGDRKTAAVLQAYARTWSEESGTLSDPQLLERVARSELTRADDPLRLLWIAVALDDAGSRPDARRLLERLHADDPRPSAAMAPPSWYIARSFARSGDVESARRWTAVARGIAPADPDVLALSSALGDARAQGELIRLYDPFTAGLALAEARLSLCRDSECDAVLQTFAELTGQIPLWSRPARMAAEMEASRSVATPHP